MGKQRGFSLAELILAMGTLAVCVLTILVLVVSLTRTSRKSVDTSVAHLAAEQILTQLTYDAQWNDHAAFWDTPNHTPYRQGQVIVNRTDYTYELDAIEVRDTSSVPIGNGLGFNRLKLVTLRLSWWNGDSQNRAGYGRLNTEVKRIVHETPITP